MSSTALAKTTTSAIAAFDMPEQELIAVLQDSVYPGAKDASIKMIINVCRASLKDPLMKPYHIVPMPVPTGEKDSQGYDIKRLRDVVMPGINNYRVDAARTGQHAGTSEPEFGDDITEVLDGVSITYPKWCKVVVKRLMDNGQVVEFTAKEIWKENYATKSNKSEAPNAMWKKRPYGQIAKCAEAQALRKGFPEVGNQPTADEMEGKEIDITPEPIGDQKTQEPAQPQYYAEAEFDSKRTEWSGIVSSGRKTAESLIATVESRGKKFTEEQVKIIKGWEKKPDVIDGEAQKVDDPFVSEMEEQDKKGGQA